MSKFCFTGTIQHLPGLFISGIFILENNLLLLGLLALKSSCLLLSFTVTE